MGKNNTLSGDVIYPRVSIIIPNYNGSHLLKRNIPAVLSSVHSYPGGGEVLVVDDASNDDSADLLESQFPQVVCVQHDVNEGFSEAIWSGVNAARNEYLILLNSDVCPEDGFIEPLIRVLMEKDVFAVQPAIKDDAGHIDPHVFRFRFSLGRLKRLITQDLKGMGRCYCVYTSGGSMAVQKSKFLSLGGFHPIFKPFYWEDFDLGFRAWRRGWKSVVIPASVVHHQDQGSIRDNYKKRKIKNAQDRNKLVMEWVHFPLFGLFFTALPRLAGRLVARLLRGDVTYFKVIYGALCKMPDIVRLRQEIESTSSLGFLEVIDLVESLNGNEKSMDHSRCCH